MTKNEIAENINKTVKGIGRTIALNNKVDFKVGQILRSNCKKNIGGENGNKKGSRSEERREENMGSREKSNRKRTE